MAATQNERRALATPEQLSEYLGIPMKTLYQWRYEGHGPKGVRIGKHLRYRWENVDAWVAQQEAAS